MATLPVARGANGQPPRPPTDASSTDAPASSAAQRVRDAVWRVSWKWTAVAARATRPARRAAHGPGVATPIVSARTNSPLPRPRDAGEVGDAAGVDLALEGAAEGDADRHGRRPVAAASTPPARERLGERAFPFRRLNASVAASVRFAPVEPRCGEPLLARARSGRARRLDAVDVARSGDDLLRAGHLRHALARRRSSPPRPGEARRGEPPRELSAHAGREHRRLVLEPVARADVADGRR